MFHAEIARKVKASLLELGCQAPRVAQVESRKLIPKDKPDAAEDWWRANLSNVSCDAPVEHTVAGKLIGAVHDFARGQAKNDLEALQRAQAHDNIAEIAADTVAMLPGTKLFGAGACRAALLLDPTKSMFDNLPGAAKNFAEGMALHGASKLGGLHTESGQLASQLEAKNLFAMGFSTGATKAAFNENSWIDDTGTLSLGKGVRNILRAGTTGGVIGVPAGLAGNVLGRTAGEAFTELGLPKRVAAIGLSASSGYTAGLMFGGIDAALKGGSAWDVLSAANEGGLVGLFTGTVGGAFTKLPAGNNLHSDTASDTSRTRRFATRVDELSEPVQVARSLRLAAAMEGTPISSREISAVKIAAVNEGTTLFDSIHINPPKEVPLLERLEVLGSFSKGEENLLFRRDDVAIRPEHADLNLFTEECLVERNVDVRSYRVHGTRIIVPEEYGQALDHVLDLRQKASRAGEFPQESTSADAVAARKAAAELAQHPLRNRLHPVDLVPVLDQVPDLGLVTKIILRDLPSPEDPWHRLTYEPNFSSAATACDDGIITFYEANRTASIGRYLRHEWAHLLKARIERDHPGTLFETAAAKDKKEYISDYAKRDIDENWAEHTAALLDLDGDVFLHATSMAPLRAAVIGQALERALSAGDGYAFGPTLSRRLDYIKKNVTPLAVDVAAEQAVHGKTVDERMTGINLLDYLSYSPKSLETLQRIAKTGDLDSIRSAAFAAGWSKAFYGDHGWTDYGTRTVCSTIDSRVNFLIDLSAPTSKCKDVALSYLDSMPGQRAEAYYSLYTVDQHGGSKAQRLVDIMKTMPDDAGRKLAWDAGLRLTKENPEERLQFLISSADRVPQVRTDALDMLAGTADLKARPVLRKLTGSSNPTWAQRAKEGLAHIEHVDAIRTAIAKAQSGSPPERLEAIRLLGGTGDNLALKELLRQAVAGNEQESALAYSLLRSNFSRQLVRFYASELAREQPALHARLRLRL